MAFSDCPRLEPETEGEHIGVGADTRVLEQVPGAAEVLPALQDHIALVRAAVLQMPGRTDAGDTGSHDDDVDKFGHAVKLSTLCRISQRCVEEFDMRVKLLAVTTASQPRAARGRRAPGRRATTVSSLSSRRRDSCSTSARIAEISVDDLAKGAGISRPTFYFYFPSKDAVLFALFERVISEADAAFERHDAALPEAADHYEMCRSGINVFFDTFVRHRTVTRAAQEVRHSHPEVRDLLAKFMKKWIDKTAATIEMARAAGMAPTTLPAHDLATALNLMNERAFVRIVQRRGEPAHTPPTRLLDTACAHLGHQHLRRVPLDGASLCQEACVCRLYGGCWWVREVTCPKSQRDGVSSWPRWTTGAAPECPPGPAPESEPRRGSSCR